MEVVPAQGRSLADRMAYAEALHALPTLSGEIMTDDAPAMNRNFYRFRSEWRLNAPPDEVFGALAELDDYPVWWPEVRTVRRLSAETRRLTCRSALPYDLDFTIRQSVNDRPAGILEAVLNGDLEGFSRWTISATSSGTLAVFDEEVIANKRLLRWLALLARPAFVINHSLMMRHGRQGLAAYLVARSS